MSEKIKPALTEGWEVVTIPGISPDHALALRSSSVGGYIEVKTHANFADLKATADRIATALNGFTREDVALLRQYPPWKGFPVGENPGIGSALISLADRIEALLPPE